MPRFTFPCVFLAGSLSLAMVGCAERPRQAPRPATVAASKPALPAEVNAPVKPLILPGRWKASGIDKAGHKWEGYLVVDHAPDAYMKAGYFEWEVKIGGGRYHFDGTFDPTTRAVRWVGYNVEERVGNPAMATYLATLSEDGKSFETGSWSGGISIPGSWTAEYVGQ